MKIKGVTFVLVKFICIFHHEGTDSTTHTRRRADQCRVCRENRHLHFFVIAYIDRAEQTQPGSRDAHS